MVLHLPWYATNGMPPNSKDASGTVVRLPRRPERIVSLVPSVTETLFALGLGDQVVGVTDWCIHPADALTHVSRVKGTKNPDLTTIEALHPDLVIANLEENREVDVSRMRELGLCVWVDFPCTVPEVIEHVAWLAALGAPDERAATLLDSLRRASDESLERTPVPQRCFLAVWKDPWMTIGAATYAHDLLRRLGLNNVFADSSERYPRVSIEEIEARDPEVILLPDEPYAFTRDDAESLRERLFRTSAARAGRVYVADGTLAFWHGPRTVRVLREGLTPKAM